MNFSKHLENSAPFAIRLLWLCLIVGPTFWLISSVIRFAGMTSSEAASWVQAIGSIGAIAGACAVAIWQNHKQQVHREKEKSDRLLSIYAVIESSARHAISLGGLAEKRPPDFVFRGSWSSVTGAPVRATVHGLKAIPVHELGKAELVVQCMSIIGAMTQMLTDVDLYLSEPPSMERTLDTYEKVSLQAKLVAYSWDKFSEHAGLSISSPGSC